MNSEGTPLISGPPFPICEAKGLRISEDLPSPSCYKSMTICLAGKINPPLNQQFPSLHVACQGNFSVKLMRCENLSQLPSPGTSSAEIER